MATKEPPITCMMQPLSQRLEKLMCGCGMDEQSLVQQFPPLKPSKKFEVVWKTLGKQFATLGLDDADFVIHMAVRNNSEPLSTYTLDKHAKLTLDAVYQMLPATIPPESRDAAGTGFLPGWMIRHPTSCTSSSTSLQTPSGVSTNDVCHRHIHRRRLRPHERRARPASTRDGGGGCCGSNLPPCSASSAAVPPPAASSSAGGGGGAARRRPHLRLELPNSAQPTRRHVASRGGQSPEGRARSLVTAGPDPTPAPAPAPVSCGCGCAVTRGNHVNRFELIAPPRALRSAHLARPLVAATIHGTRWPGTRAALAPPGGGGGGGGGGSLLLLVGLLPRGGYGVDGRLRVPQLGRPAIDERHERLGRRQCGRCSERRRRQREHHRPAQQLLRVSWRSPRKHRKRSAASCGLALYGKHERAARNRCTGAGAGARCAISTACRPVYRCPSGRTAAAADRR